MAGPRPLIPSDVRYLVVHCTGTPASVDLSVDDIDRQHRAMGRLRIGYHFVIARAGLTHLGRPMTQRGQHIEGFNHCSLGICVVGGGSATKIVKPEANFTWGQLLATRALLEFLKSHFPNARPARPQDMPDGAAGLLVTPFEL